MGAAAFIMAQLIGIPYREVVIAATIPALLYFFALIVDIDLESGRLGISSLDSREIPSVWTTLRNGWPHLISPAVLLYLLVIAGRSPMRAGLYSVGAMLAVTLIKRSTRWNIKQLLEGLEAGAQSAVPVALATAGAGIVIASLSLTGLGLRMSGLLVDAAGGNLFVLLLMTMGASIVLGLGLPTVAAYLILAVTIAPALIQLDVPPLGAHMFIFYFGVMSASTPPVALAAFAASGIAGSDPMRTAFTSVRLGWIAFIVPFLFIYEPVLLADGRGLAIGLAVGSALLAVISVVAAAQGHLFTRVPLVQRVALVVGGLLLLVPGVVGDAPGYAILAVIAALNFRVRRAENKARKQARRQAPKPAGEQVDGETAPDLHSDVRGPTRDA
jgi:TRAP transporter 4TM/12TM fusion protein